MWELLLKLPPLCSYLFSLFLLYQTVGSNWMGIISFGSGDLGDGGVGGRGESWLW